MLIIILNGLSVKKSNVFDKKVQIIRICIAKGPVSKKHRAHGSSDLSRPRAERTDTTHLHRLSKSQDCTFPFAEKYQRTRSALAAENCVEGTLGESKDSLSIVGAKLLPPKGWPIYAWRGGHPGPPSLMIWTAGKR